MHILYNELTVGCKLKYRALSTNCLLCSLLRSCNLCLNLRATLMSIHLLEH